MKNIFAFWMLNVLFLGPVFSQVSKDTIRVMSYNLLNFPDGRTDCTNNTLVPNRFDTLRKIVAYSKPDMIGAMEVQTKRGADSVLTRALNIQPGSNYAMAPWQPSSTGGGALNNAFFYNADKLALKAQYAIATGVRDVNHYILYALDPNLSQLYDTTYFEVFVCHLKAGSGNAEKNQRGEQMDLLRSYIDARPLGRNYILMGDLNTYTSTEPCYQKLISGGLNPFKDPINRAGSWNNAAAFRDIHTQSTRNTGNYDCGSTGGMDDRFDHIVLTGNMLTTQHRVRYLSGSYKALGNDGNHFNQSINAGTNSQYPSDLVRALFYMSDHLPVILDLEITYPTENGLALLPTWSNIACGGTNDAWAKVSPNAGVAPYTYLWSASAGSQTTQTATNLAAGVHCVYVTDQTGFKDTVCVQISTLSDIQTTVFKSDDTGVCNGMANLLAFGGVGAYSFSWAHDSSISSSAVQGLCAGTYYCTISDESGCSITKEIVIEEKLAIGSLDSSTVDIYPNPAKDHVTISLKYAQALHIKMVDLSGKMVKEQTFPEGKIHLISLDDLESGIYFLQNGKQNIARIIKD